MVVAWADHNHGGSRAQRLGGHQDMVFRNQSGNDEYVATGLEAQRGGEFASRFRIVDAVRDLGAGLRVAGRVARHFGVVGDDEVGRQGRGAFGPLEVALHGGAILAAHPLEAVEVHGERSGSAQRFQGKPWSGRGGSEGKVDVGPLLGRIAKA